MNIDLLITKEGEAGLIASENLVKKAAGILIDTETGTLSIEFADMDHLDLNIPVEDRLARALDGNAQLHIGAVKNGNIAQAYQVPLMFSDDPYRGELLGQGKSPLPLVAFASFMKKCAFGQPVHRDDLGSEEDMGCILGDSSPAALDFAPHLARAHAMEARPAAAPNMTPPGMGLGGPGGSGGGGYQQTRRWNNTDDDDG